MLHLNTGDIKMTKAKRLSKKRYAEIKQEKADGNIYLLVGDEKYITDYDSLNIEKYDREIIRAYNKYCDCKLLAVYKTSEFVDADLKIIRQHTLSDAEYKGKKIKYYGFTHCHFFETLRNRKKKMLKEKSIKDDGTIFQKVSKTITIPEQVIPEHKAEIYVEWDCFEDSHTTEDAENDRYC